MLTPGFLRDITERTEAATAKMNEKLSGRIAKRILAVFQPEKGVAMIPATISDFRKMVSSGLSVDEIVDLVSKSMPEIKEEVRKAFYATAVQVAKESDDFARKLVDVSPELRHDLDAAGVKMPEPLDTYNLDLPRDAAKMGLSQHELRMMEQAYTATNGLIDNLTRTTATAWQEEFREACNTAFWKIQHGVSMNDAISEAIDEAAKYGTHVEYPSGHKDRVEVAVARAVRTGVSKAAGDMVLSRCAREGVDYVVVSSHLGARTTDKAEPANHASWQGKVYRLNWADPAMKQYEAARKERTERANIFVRFFQSLKKKWNDRKYEDFVTVTGYGTGAGLCGYNCRHSFTPFYPGVSTNNQKQYDLEENEKVYKLTQLQRSREREIRELKRRKAAAETALKSATDPVSRASVEQLLAERADELHKAILKYNDFCKKNGLKTMHERTRIPKLINIEKSEAPDIMISGARIVDPDSDEAIEFANMYYPEIRKMTTDVKRISSNTGISIEIIQEIKNYLFLEKSYYDPDTGKYERFDPDCAIAQSWQRLLIGTDIKHHDIILLQHEMLEMEIKRNNPEMEHSTAHMIASEKYNYQKEVVSYYDGLKKH